MLLFSSSTSRRKTETEHVYLTCANKLFFVLTEFCDGINGSGDVPDGSGLARLVLWGSGVERPYDVRRAATDAANRARAQLLSRQQRHGPGHWRYQTGTHGQWFVFFWSLKFYGTCVSTKRPWVVWGRWLCQSTDGHWKPNTGFMGKILPNFSLPRQQNVHFFQQRENAPVSHPKQFFFFDCEDTFNFHSEFSCVARQILFVAVNMLWRAIQCTHVVLRHFSIKLLSWELYCEIVCPTLRLFRNSHGFNFFSGLLWKKISNGSVCGLHPDEHCWSFQTEGASPFPRSHNHFSFRFKSLRFAVLSRYNFLSTQRREFWRIFWSSQFTKSNSNTSHSSLCRWSLYFHFCGINFERDSLSAITNCKTCPDLWE